jgi:CheY-like chemotaxis protein
MPAERVPVVLIVDDEEDIRLVLQARLETSPASGRPRRTSSYWT